jgi:hypothetical protein
MTATMDPPAQRMMAPETAINPATGKPWPVIDRSRELAQRKVKGVKRRFRLLQGHFVETIQIGVTRPTEKFPMGEPVLEDARVYPGAVVESTEDLCKLYNGGTTNPAYRKFELIPDNNVVLDDGSFVWDTKTETIDQFLARTGAQVKGGTIMENQQTQKTDVQKAAEAGFNDLKGDRKPELPKPDAPKKDISKLPILDLKELAEEHEIDITGITQHAQILAKLRAAGL